MVQGALLSPLPRPALYVRVSLAIVLSFLLFVVAVRSAAFG